MTGEAVSKHEAGRGREAEWPSQIPAKGWKDIAWRVWGETSEDRVMLVAAGATFYLLLALFPALAAFVSVYGFVADPTTIADHVSYLGGLLPRGGIELIESQLESLARQDPNALSISFVVGLLVAFWSANNGMKTIFEALNIAYEEREKRSFIKLNLTAFIFTLGAMLVGILMIVAVGVVPALLAFLNLGGFSEIIIAVTRWPLILIVIGFAIALIYRFGPSRARAKWRWVSWGSGLATVVWVLASWGFSYYLQNFADYNATYGSLGAVIGFMLWTWISSIILLVGAELNAEMEHQTAQDSTTGAPRPKGERGAVVADTIGAKWGEKRSAEG